MGKLSYNGTLRTEQGLGVCVCVVRKPLFPVTQWWKLRTVKKSAVESTSLAQPFCINHAAEEMSQRLHAQFVV